MPLAPTSVPPVMGHRMQRACGGLNVGFPLDLSQHGHLIDELFFLTFCLTAGSFVIVLAILGYCLVVFRRIPGRAALFTRGDSRGAIILTLGLALLVFFGIDVNLAYHDHHVYQKLLKRLPEDANPLKVEILAEQFAWNVRYPGPDGTLGRTDMLKASETDRFGIDASDPASADDIITINDLTVPVDTDILLDLRSRDVIHSFFLPAFRVKQDIVPGLTTQMHFRAKETGEHEIACAELCGLGHYRMRGTIKVVSASDYAAWLKTKKEADTFEEVDESEPKSAVPGTN